MDTEVYKWIVNSVCQYFYTGRYFFEFPNTELKITITRNKEFSHFIEFTNGQKISIISGQWMMKRDEMIDVLDKCYNQDLKKQEPNKSKKIYDWICSCVYMLDDSERRYFINEDEKFMLDVYKHKLSDNKFDYWITSKDMKQKEYLNNKITIAEDLIDKIYSSYLKDFCVHNEALNDPDYYKNKNHTLQLQKEDKDRQIFELKDKNSYLLEMVSDLKRINRSIIIDNNKKTTENYELRNEVKRLQERLQEEKNAHTTTQCRVIFARHILNGDRDEKVKEHIKSNGI